MKTKQDEKLYIEELIRLTVEESHFNRLAYLDDSLVSEEPLIGFADAYDPLIAEFKRAVGPSHLSPLEAWQRAFPDANRPEHLSITAWILPFSAAIRESNKGPSTPSRHWVHGRLHIEAVNNEIRDRVVMYLSTHGYRAVAPVRSEMFAVDWDAPNGPVSTWSERHYSYAAGLGSFGLNRGLITARGMAMRCGSIVADVSLAPSERSGSLTANCPFLETGGCGDCIQRCPVGAITAEGKDNIKCYRYLFEEIGPSLDEYVTPDAIEATNSATAGRIGVCGLCQTDVPCESSIPPPSLLVRSN